MPSTETQLKQDIHMVQTRWLGKMHFESRVNDHVINMDKLELHGGENAGPRPKPLILSAIGGCTGMEIISILDKMRISADTLDVEVNGELTTEIPKMYKSVHINFKIKCSEKDHQKVIKAINLAVDKYCGVLAMVRKFAQVTWSINF